MKGFVVKLREDGLFEAKSIYPGHSSIRVVHEPSAGANPWVAMSLDQLGIKWTQLDDFFCLAAALDFAVCQARQEYPTPEYTVELPDGQSFSRPGRISLEQVMASAGWIYVTDVIGFAVMTTETSINHIEARSIFMSRLGEHCGVVGYADVCDTDEDGEHWCIDVTLPYGGFVHKDRVQSEARMAFATEGLDVIQNFDFKTRSNVASNQANIIMFPEDRIVRMTAA